MKSLIIATLLLAVMGCATSNTPETRTGSLPPDSFAALSHACDHFDLDACLKAGDIDFNLSPNDIKPCTGGDRQLCIRPAETRTQAEQRIDLAAAQAYGVACHLANNGRACLNAGSLLTNISDSMPMTRYRAVASRAEAYFDKACKLGEKFGCAFRGTTFRAGAPKLDPQQQTREKVAILVADKVTPGCLAKLRETQGTIEKLVLRNGGPDGLTELNDARTCTCVEQILLAKLTRQILQSPDQTRALMAQTSAFCTARALQNNIERACLSGLGASYLQTHGKADAVPDDLEGYCACVDADYAGLSAPEVLQKAGASFLKFENRKNGVEGPDDVNPTEATWKQCAAKL